MDLALAGRRDESLVLLGAAAVVWAMLALGGTLSLHLAGVPATGVLATRLMAFGWPQCSAVLAVGAALLAFHHRRALWQRPARATGTDLLATVALQSVGIAAAPWSRPLTVLLVAVGLTRYGATIVRFPVAELTEGEGDHWIAGGAVAISSVAAARADLGAVALALWIFALAWLLLLVAGEAARPRRGSASRRWATVFPLGMYAAMTYTIGGMEDLAHVLTAVAALAWLAVLTANVAMWRPCGRRHPRTRVDHPPRAGT